MSRECHKSECPKHNKIEPFCDEDICIESKKGSCGCGSTKYEPNHMPWDHAGWKPD
jgi:hypothetical protein